MKNTFKILTVLAAGILNLTSCMDGDWDTPQSIQENPPYGDNTIQKSENVITVAQLKSQYASVISGNSYKQITDSLQLQVVVNGNDAGGNIYKQISVQDATGGIIVGINATDQYAFMPVGQKLLINLKGLYIGGYGTQAQLGALYSGSIGRMDLAVWKQHVRLVKDDVIPTAIVDTINFDSSKSATEMCGRVVCLKDVTISGSGTQTLAPEDGSVTLTSNCANRTINGNSKIVLRTSTYSDFAGVKIPTDEKGNPAKVTLYGVCTIYNGTWQILARTESDLTWLK